MIKVSISFFLFIRIMSYHRGHTYSVEFAFVTKKLLQSIHSYLKCVLITLNDPQYNNLWFISV